MKVRVLEITIVILGLFTLCCSLIPAGYQGIRQDGEFDMLETDSKLESTIDLSCHCTDYDCVCQKECYCKVIHQSGLSKDGYAWPESNDHIPSGASTSKQVFKCSCDFDKNTLDISNDQGLDCECTAAKCDCKKKCHCSSKESSSRLRTASETVSATESSETVPVTEATRTVPVTDDTRIVPENYDSESIKQTIKDRQDSIKYTNTSTHNKINLESLDSLDVEDMDETPDVSQQINGPLDVIDVLDLDDSEIQYQDVTAELEVTGLDHNE